MAEAGLDVLDGAQADQGASHHDAHAATQRLALLHTVRGQHGAHLLVRHRLGDEVPHGSPRHGVHAATGLIQKQNRRIPYLPHPHPMQITDQAPGKSIDQVTMYTDPDL